MMYDMRAPNVFATSPTNSGMMTSLTALAYPMLMAGGGMGMPSPMKKKKQLGMGAQGGPMGQNVFAGAPPMRRAGGF